MCEVEGTRVISVAIAPLYKVRASITYCLDGGGVGIAVGGGDGCLAAIGGREIDGVA